LCHSSKQWLEVITEDYTQDCEEREWYFLTFF
jgi:hypothetical protein